MPVTSPLPSGRTARSCAASKPVGTIDQPVPRHRPRAGRVTAAFDDPPELLARQRVVAVDRLRSDADEHRASRRPSRSAASRSPCGSRRPPSASRPAPRSWKSTDRVGPPDRLARALVERDDELMVAAVEVHDQQVAEEDRRRAGAAEVVALEVAPLPDAPCRSWCRSRRCPATRRSRRRVPARSTGVGEA